MKRTTAWPQTLEVDYSAARAHAISWLGDRYLLARPINAKHHAGGKILPASRGATPGGIGRVTHCDE